ncbi:MAG: SHOCT domain-containing protein [Chloroflexota bacterium]
MVLDSSFGGGIMGGGMMGPGMLGGWGAMSPAWSAATIIFWLLIIAGAVLLVIWAVRQAGPKEPVSRRPLDILNERYARGELSREQFEQMRRDLE